jgi:pimeloyl-ACP methyl ester carboxylesterase
MTTYNYADVHGNKMFYRETGDKKSPSIVLLHGFPTSSHMYRNLIPQLAKGIHVIAPDYIGFGYSDAPNPADFSYTFDNLAKYVEALLFGALGLKKFSIYVQDYGAPVGYRIASKRPQAVDAIIVQNGNAYLEGIGGAFDPMKPFWANRNAKQRNPYVRCSRWRQPPFSTHAARRIRNGLVPTIGRLTRSSSIVMEMTQSNSTCSTIITPTSRTTTDGTSTSLPASLAP